MCPHCRAFITDKDKICPYCNETVGPRYAERANAAAVIGGFIPHARFNTVLILLINGGLFVATALYCMRAGLGGGSATSTAGCSMRLAPKSDCSTWMANGGVW